MHKAYLVSTGTELLLGKTIDTNSVFLAERLSNMGIKVVGKSVVGDNREHIRNAISLGIKSADIVITTGGLGPTLDDLTKEVACEVLNCPMVKIEAEVNKLREYFRKRNRNMPEINLKQAMFPVDAKIITNNNGTAPGMYLNKSGKTLICLPGPPHEIMPMYIQEVEPLLQKDYGQNNQQSAVVAINIFGPGESQVEEMLAEIVEDPRGCSLALIAKEGEIQLRITAEGKDTSHSQTILNELVDKIKSILGDRIYGYNEDALPVVVANILLQQKLSLAVAESCTGGLLAKMLTDMPGSSEYFWGGAVSYSNEAKTKIMGVNDKIISQYGAVSEPVAREMAIQIRKLAGSEIGVSITGVAGPGGGSEINPVGTVYIGADSQRGTQVKRLYFVGNREAIRTLAAKSALDWLRKLILNNEI
ncbi:MAG: competence/damage-inducible protein A [Syntrophomonadaceae bacterium]|nr:competence/damage-inducible protein A [Syntrophomonadaceae bacterium]